MADGGNEVARAYITLVPSLEGAQQSIAEQLGASAGSASKDIGEQSGKDFGEAMAVGIKATATVIVGAMTAVIGAAVATGKAFLDSASDVAEWGNQIDKDSQKLQWSSEAYQNWAFILEHTGASIDGMKTAMKKLTVAAEEGNDAFTQLGISQEELEQMSPEQLWEKTISSLQDVSDEGERLALANELLGKQSVELLPLLNMTAEETEAMKDEFAELGGMMSDEAVKASAEYEDQLQNMNTALTGVKNNMMSKFLPAMSLVMEGLSEVFSGQGGIEKIKEGLADLTANIVELSPQFLELAQTIVLGVLEGFAPMLPTLTEALFSFLGQALTTLTSLIPQLLPVITTGIEGIMSAVFSCLPLIISSLLTLITDLATWLASGDNVKTFADGLVQLVSLLVKQIGILLPILLPAIVEIIKEVALTITSPENIQLLLDAVLTVVGGILFALANSIPAFVEYIVGLVTNIKDNIINLFNWLSPYFSAGWNNLLNTVKNWGSNIKNFITTIVNNVKTTIQTWITGLATSFSNGFTNIQNWVNNIVNKIQNFVSNCINTLWQLPSEMASVAYDMVAGFVGGLDVDWVVKEVKKLGKKAISALKDTLGIASPSKVFKELGQYTAEGFGIGYSDTMDDVQTDIAKAAEGFTTSMSAEFSAYGAGNAQTVGDTTNYNGGNISINVYGAEGQDVNSLAESIAQKLEDMTTRRRTVYA